MSDYIIFYTESNLVCIVIFGIMLIHDLLNVDRQEKQIKFDTALIVFMLYFISDIIWAGILDGVFPKTSFTVAAANFSNYLLMAGVTYAWLVYVMAVEKVPRRNSAAKKLGIILPFLIATVILVIVYIAAPQVLVNDALEMQPAYYVFLIIVPIINICAVVVYTFRKAMAEKNPVEKKQHLYIGLFPVFLIVGGIVQLVLLPDTPIFCFCCVILMLMMYIQSMEEQISIDPLTKLNNRAQLIRYVSQRSGSFRKDQLTYVIMVDINSFKKVNDTYGHAEGDRALIIVADSLKDISKISSMPMFLGRYGGDEFVLIVHPGREEELELLIRGIRNRIKERCRMLETPYVLSIGVGYDRLGDESDTIQKCIQRADQNMYYDKEHVKKHAG